jgi:hypothetical protein
VPKDPGAALGRDPVVVENKSVGCADETRATAIEELQWNQKTAEAGRHTARIGTR